MIRDRLSPSPARLTPVNAIRYLNPPQFSPKFDQNIESLISNTLTQAGANDAALGDIRPDNTSAIIAVREAATMPMQMVQNRYYAFCEEIARIWAEFWMMKYGKRALKIEDETGTWYLPFDGERYKERLSRRRWRSVRPHCGAKPSPSARLIICSIGRLLTWYSTCQGCRREQFQM